MLKLPFSVWPYRHESEDTYKHEIQRQRDVHVRRCFYYYVAL